MSLPERANVRSTPAPNQNVTSIQSAPGRIEKIDDDLKPLPTPNSLPKHLRERFYYTPGLSSFLNRILHLSVISRSSPEDLANEFFDRYSKSLEKGYKYPALKAYSAMINASFSS